MKKSLSALGIFILVGAQSTSFATELQRDEQKKDEPELSTVQIAAKKNKGDVSYHAFLKLQKRLIDYLPPEPRILSYLNRLSFTELKDAERDDFEAKTWGVSIVGDTVDYVIPMRRGGYFLIPELPDAIKERATLVFNSQTRKNFVGVAWQVNFRENQMPYTDFAKALSEVKEVQGKIKWYELLNFSTEKKAVFDSMKVCFVEDKGTISLGDQAGDVLSHGRCQYLKFDQKQVGESPLIRFNGEVDIVTLEAFPGS